MSKSRKPSAHQPRFSSEHVRKIQAWQDQAYLEMKNRALETSEYFGRTLTIFPTVQPITGMSDLLGSAVLDEVRETDRVLDMGTGSGVNAILAASKSTQVVAVDVNPNAVACAKQNARTNGVESRVSVIQSDVFEGVDGKFDLIIFDPPFRWFPPRDIFEVSTTDENYQALTRFFADVGNYLNDRGRVLIFFGTSGDLDYLNGLIVRTGFQKETVATRDLVRGEMTITYHTFRLSRAGPNHDRLQG